MKLLNLDDIALDSQRTVKYKGKEYKVVDFNVSEFIEFQKHFNAFTKHYNSPEEGSLPKVIEAAEALTNIGVPEFPQAEIRKLNPVQMLALVSMIANLIPNADEDTAKGVASTDAGTVSPKKAKTQRQK